MAEHQDHVEGPDEATWPHGPYMTPMDRWAQLPEWKRQWFEDQSKGNLDDITNAAIMWRRLNDWGRITKWLILSVVAIILGSVALKDAIVNALNSLGFGHR